MSTPLEKISKYIRAANYLTVTQIYLQDNFLLERPLVSEDIKPRLFGHWGTCPGINFVYGHLQYMVKKHKQSAIFVLGPGHGMPGLQSNLFLEGTLEKYYPKATRDTKGIEYVSKMFAWPYGFSSHCSPETPGLILEGGELGYSLATAYGAVMDNPDLLAVCLVGDGEAETGALAASWHISKLLDPRENGAVLPILHLNGYKISGPSIFGRMSNAELSHLFKGYGYEPLFVEGKDIDQKMFDTMEKCHAKISEIQKRAKSGEVFKPIYPMIVMRTAKGWTTVKELRKQKIEGTILAHQVVMPTVKNDEEELRALETWLRSYRFEELFDAKKGFDKDILSVIPNDKLLIGDNKHMFGSQYRELNLPDSKKLAKEMDAPGKMQSNSMRMAGEYLREIFALNKKQKNFRLMSPDETYSNRLDAVFGETARGFVWPIVESDKDMTRNGRVMEMLSEHNMHGMTQGYVLTGRHAVFTTYEAFAQVFSSMAHMYQKFLKFVRVCSWRQDIASINYLLTSTAWRQEHNGYSHQNPSFVSGMLDKYADFVKAYFPVDDNSMLAIMEETMSSKNQMNIITAGKTPEPRWMTYAMAKDALKDGIATWDFASDENPHVVLAGIGDYATKEALAALDIVKRETPSVRIRFVNVLRLQGKSSHKRDRQAQIPNAEKYFTVDKPVIVNFHGYPEVMESIALGIKNPERFSIYGYVEQGGTTTPFDMQVRNHTDRFHLAMEIFETATKCGALAIEQKDLLVAKYNKTISDHTAFVKKNGYDPAEIENWQWQGIASEIVATQETAHYEEVIKNARTIAFVGLSDNPERHSHIVAKYFQSKGYKIIPVNPKLSYVLGEKAYPSLRSIPKNIHIDIVDIFRKPKEVVPHMREIVEMGGIKTVWLAEGINSTKAEEFAEDYGLALITNHCIMTAHGNGADFKGMSI